MEGCGAQDKRKANITNVCLFVCFFVFVFQIKNKTKQFFFVLFEEWGHWVPDIHYISIFERELSSLIISILDRGYLKQSNPTKVKKIRNCNSLVEVNSWRHAENILSMKTVTD